MHNDTLASMSITSGLAAFVLPNTWILKAPIRMSSALVANSAPANISRLNSGDIFNPKICLNVIFVRVVQNAEKENYKLLLCLR